VYIVANRIIENKVVKRLLLAAAIVMIGGLFGLMAMDAGNIRFLITVSLVTVLAAVQLRSPQLAIYLLLVFLPFLGILRRVLIPVVGWNSMDALIVLGPIVVLLLSMNWLIRKYVVREPIADDTRLFRMIRWMLLFDCLQVFNPLQGSFFVGLSGIIYYIVPVLFMILGREYFNEMWIKKIFCTVFIIGIATALYGYKQYWFGFYDFEEAWINLGGYVALQVGEVTRPISTFTNAAEYAHYLGIAIVIGWGYFLRGASNIKLVALIGVTVLYVALFIESGRSTIVTVTAALFVMTVFNVRKPGARLLLSISAVTVLAGLFYGLTRLESENDLIDHSVMGLTDPLGDHSTLPGHVDLMMRGFVEGIKAPFGYGLGSTSIASGKFGGLQIGSEIDLSNKFLATGVIGGFLYLTIFAMVLRLGFREANKGGAVRLTILGLLVAETFQWLTGGHYAVVAVLWIAIGFLDRSSAESADRKEPVPGSAKSAVQGR